MFGLRRIYLGFRGSFGGSGGMRSRSFISLLRWSSGVELQRSKMLAAYYGVMDI